MLKGDVFSNQLFNVHIFALFINTFLDGKNGIIEDYKNGMAVTSSNTSLSISNGACVVQGRFMEEDSSTTISTSSITNKYCSLVIEINLDETNTDSTLNQATYKIITGNSTYPTLIQNDIVNNVSGVYQYELVKFKTDSSGNISNLVVNEEYLSIESVYEAFAEEMQDKLDDLQEAINNVTTDTILARLSAVETIAGKSQFKKLTYTGTRNITLTAEESAYPFIEIIYGKTGSNTFKSTGKIILSDDPMSIILDQAQIVTISGNVNIFQVYTAYCNVSTANNQKTLTISGNEGYINYNMRTNAWDKRTGETDMQIYGIILYQDNEVS